MTRYHLFASVVLAVVACGPAETLPNNDAGASTNDAGETCVGVCVPGLPAFWEGPYLLWTGDEADAPRCSDVAGGLSEAYTGYGYPDGSIICGACTCAPPSGSCELPATLTTAAASCAGNSPSVAHLSFDPPNDWTGTCTAENTVPAGTLCGSVACVQSVTIAPLTMKQGGCLPIETPSVKPPPPSAFARACGLGLAPSCTQSTGVCVPAAPGPEFKQCIGFRLDSQGESGLSKCPPSYPNRNVFYKGDPLSCTPCACDAPVGSHCTGSLDLSAKSACNPPLVPTIYLDAKEATCVDLPPGSALGSKSATEPDYSPGKCQPSGGKPLGTVFCCQP